MDSVLKTNSDNFVKENGPILHVVLVAFNHKRGCEIEYVFPPFDNELSGENVRCPEEWKHLPSLALPDGAHNFEKDTVFFHLPSRSDSSKTVFGISCYRQMNAECLINKSSDITRGSVQKSVCVLSTLPLYGLINAKLELVTHAYFDERDFTKVALLEETYKYLNSSLKETLTQGHQIFLGLSVRDLVLRFKHRLVLLLKLLLLEKRVLFLKSPVKTLCTTILSLLSVFPGMIEDGLENCLTLCYDDYKEFELISNLEDNEKQEQSEIEKANLNEDEIVNINSGENKHDKVKKEDNNLALKKTKCLVEEDARVDQLLVDLDDLLDGELKEKVDLTKSKLEFCDKDTYSAAESDASDNYVDCLKGSNKSLDLQSTDGNLDNTARQSIRGRIFNSLNFWGNKEKNEQNSFVDPSFINGALDDENEPVVNSSEKDELKEDVSKLESPAVEEQCFVSINDVLNLDLHKCGFPLRIFGNGNLCHPYISLPFLDLLKSDGVRGFVAGATNVLFKQKRSLIDVFVDLEDGKIDILDLDLKKELYLTTEDLRFGDFLVKNVLEDPNDVFLDGTGWEGGDEWLRVQLKYYLLCLLRTSMLQEENKISESFNQLFMTSWKKTRNYRAWNEGEKDGILEINPGHPFHGQLSMADMKLRLSHTMLNSERGKKINQAVLNTGKAVIQTSKVLGGALSQAKSAVFSWFQASNPNPPESGDGE